MRANHQLQELEKETNESQKTGAVCRSKMKISSRLAAILIVEKKQEESRYISRLNERLQTIKETCDLIRQIQDTNTGNAENVEQLTELDILIDRLCLCDIPNLPTQLNRNSIQTWAEQYAGEQIKHLENCLKSATDQEKHKNKSESAIYSQTHKQEENGSIYISRHLRPRCQVMQLTVQERFTELPKM